MEKISCLTPYLISGKQVKDPSELQVPQASQWSKPSTQSQRKVSTTAKSKASVPLKGEEATYYSQEAKGYLLSESEHLTPEQRREISTAIRMKRHSYYRDNLPEDKQPLTLSEVKTLVSLSFSTEEAERQMRGQSGMKVGSAIE